MPGLLYDGTKSVNEFFDILFHKIKGLKKWHYNTVTQSQSLLGIE